MRSTPSAVVTVVAALGVLALAAPALAQSVTYDLQWVVVCGPDAFDLDRNVAAIHQHARGAPAQA